MGRLIEFSFTPQGNGTFVLTEDGNPRRWVMKLDATTKRGEIYEMPSAGDAEVQRARDVQVRDTGEVQKDPATDLVLPGLR